MARISWDATGEHFYETGIKNGVLYPYGNPSSQSFVPYNNGVAWNGLTSISESPSGAEATPLYADDVKYLNLFSAEEFGATIEAYTYPDEFAVLDGSASLATGVLIGQQERGMFGLCYKTAVGNDVAGSDLGYKIHIIYGAKASPSEKSYETINDTPSAITFSWEISTTPTSVTGKKATASLVIDSTKCDEVKLAQLENILYGTANSNPRLPLPDEIATLFNVTVSSIAITTPPTKTSYTAGEVFLPAGMVVTASYSDSTTGTVTTYTYSPTAALTTSDTTVTVSFGGKTATQSITVTSE